MTQPSNEQLDIMQQIKYPVGWNRPNPSRENSPFVYSPQYINPGTANGYFRNQSGNGASSEFGYSNQFTAAVTQPPGNAPALPYNILQSSLADQQSGKGVIDVAKRIYHGARKHKVLSRTLHFASKFKPELTKYANAAEAVGFGKRELMQKPIGIVPDMARPGNNFGLMPVDQRRILK